MSLIVNPYRYAGGGGGANTDDFSTNTIANYTQSSGSGGNWAIGSGVLSCSVGSQSVLTRNGVSFVDGEVSCQIINANDSGLVLRLQSAGNYYLAVITDASASPANQVTLYKCVANSFTKLGSSGSISFTRGTTHTFSFSASGTSLVAKFDGVTVASVTDSTFTATGKAGLRSNQTGTTTFDSFTWPI